MTPVSIVFAVLMTTALVVFVIGTIAKLVNYRRTPVPYPIPLAPIPRSAFGAAGRLTVEMLFFRSLFRATKTTWLFAWVFHAGLLGLVLVHVRFFVQQMPDWLLWLIPHTTIATVAFTGGLLGLLVRRIVVDRVRYISAPSDYLHLLVLLGIALTGALMSYTGSINVYQVMRFANGVITLDWQPLPVAPLRETVLLYAHLTLVAGLLLVFPVSKLIHGVGIMFNPVLTGYDRNPRS